MQFELTKPFLEELRVAIDQGNERGIIGMVHDLHPADIAEVLDELTLQEAIAFYQYLEAEKAANALMELEDDVRERFLASLTSEEIAKNFIDNLDSDDAADVINELPEKIKEEVISNLGDVEQASDIVDLLHYDEDSAGGLMAKEMIKVNVNWGIPKCVREMRKQAEDVENIFTIYVIDDDDILKGTLSLKKLLLAQANSKIESLYKQEVLSIKASASIEEVSAFMEKYDLVVLPVVDELNRLIGRITIDDVVEVMREEAEKDYQMASGLSEKVESSDTAWLLTRARLPWLLIGLLGGIFGARVISIYEHDIQIHPEMALFIPLIAAMGGNVGVQSSAIIVQSLANNTLKLDSIIGRLLKEFSVALINATICSILILAYTVFFGEPLNLSLTVSLALFSVIVYAALFGTFVPLILNKYKVDPALATGPFITTVNDILGLFIYFMIGKLIYNAF